MRADAPYCPWPSRCWTAHGAWKPRSRRADALYPPNYILPSLLAQFNETAPNTRLQLQIGNTQDVVTAVRDFATDLGFIEGPCHAEDIIVSPWLEDELVIVAAPSHPLARAAKQRKLSVKQLARAQWLLR